MLGPTPNWLSQNLWDIRPRSQYILEAFQVTLRSTRSEKAQVSVDYKTLCNDPINLCLIRLIHCTKAWHLYILGSQGKEVGHFHFCIVRSLGFMLPLGDVIWVGWFSSAKTEDALKSWRLRDIFWESQQPDNKPILSGRRSEWVTCHGPQLVPLDPFESRPEASPSWLWWAPFLGR